MLLGIDGEQNGGRKKEGAGLKKSARIFSFSAGHLYFPQAQRRGADGAKRRLNRENHAGYFAGGLGFFPTSRERPGMNMPGFSPCLLTLSERSD